MTEELNNNSSICIFCGRDIETFPNMRFVQSGVPGFGICFSCNKKISETISQYEAVNPTKSDKTKIKDFLGNLKIYKPKDIKKKLDQYVVGQDAAKISLAVAVYNHYKKAINNVNNEKDFIDKSNVLMLGPSGSGKTLLAKNIAKILGVPFCICDATTYTEAGYAGEDVESCISKLLQAADYDVEKAQVGIVFIDEIDKIAKRSSGKSLTRDVAGEGVQQGLLKIIEGSVINVPMNNVRKHPDADYVKIDTKNILFILGGAFVGLKEEKEKKLSKVGHLGFAELNESNETKKEETKNTDFTYEPEDMIQYGFIPEFIGRVPIIITLDKLTEKQFIQILVEPKDSIINQYTKLLKMDGINLTFDNDAIEAIAHKAYEKEIGARGLRSILEKIMNTYMYELPSTNKKKLNITKKIVDESFD